MCLGKWQMADFKFQSATRNMLHGQNGQKLMRAVGVEDKRASVPRADLLSCF